MAWATGTYYGRSSTGPCTLSIGADGTFSGTMNGGTQNTALNGDSGDTWIQMTSNSMSFVVTAVETGLGVMVSGYAGRVVMMRMGGIVDMCAIAFKSDTPLAMTTAATAPLPDKLLGLLASDLPPWLIGTHRGYVAGALAYPQTATAACSVRVDADGTVLLDANGRTYAAQVSGGSNPGGGDRDSSGTSRLSAYGAMTGAQPWTWSLRAQTPSGSDHVEVQVELAHTAERSQVSYAVAMVVTTSTGTVKQYDACYFPN